MKERVRAVIIGGENIVLMKRVVKDREYWVFPGGMVEKGETKKEALARECREELGIDIKIKSLLVKRDLDIYEDKQLEYFYLCEKIGGTLGTGEGPEYQEEKGYWGTHEVKEMPFGEIVKLNLLPAEVKNLALKRFSKQ